MTTPREQAIHRFSKHVAAEISPEWEVRASLKPLPAVHVVDVQGDEIFAGAPSDYEAFLFWVDELPAANWAHPCRYVLISERGTVISARREWPPVEAIHDKLEVLKRLCEWPAETDYLKLGEKPG